MRVTFPFPLAGLFAVLLMVNGLKSQDLTKLENSKQVSYALQTLFDVNNVNQISIARFNGTNRATSSKCSDQVDLLKEKLGMGSMWALQMVDAASKIPSGILNGNSQDLGMFDECVQISVNENDHQIRGRHCMYNVIASLAEQRISETLSVCLPATCEPEDVKIILQQLLDQVASIVGLDDMPLSIGETTCTSVDPPEWTAGGIVTLVGFSLLLLFLVICTICDIFARYSGDRTLTNGRLNIPCQFSLFSNAVRVLSTKTTSATLPALQGLRFWSMCWVIWGHAHIMFIQSVNLLNIIEWVPTWNALYIVIAPFSVDTFFALSGFLMSYVFLKEMSTGRSFNVFSYYLHRYIRLTPAFLAVILVTIFISPHLGSGPVWEKPTVAEQDACRSSWWTLILYLQNYVNSENGQGCLGHTWYLAVEMQFFWISPLILYPLAKKPKLGLGILSAFFIAAVVIPVKIGYDNKYSTALASKANMAQQFEGDGVMKNFYFASHVRAAPWLIGIFFGYLIFKQRGSPASKKTKWIGWLLATAAFAFCVFTMRIFEADEYEYNDVWECIYTAVVRPFWGFAVSWVMYACIRGFGGPVSTFLSFPIYTPLSRISYCAYLVHYQIQFFKIRSARTLSYFSTFNAFDHFLSDLMLSIIVGAVFTLVFESPILVLEKIVKKLSAPRKDDMKKVLKEDEVEKGITKTDFRSS